MFNSNSFLRMNCVRRLVRCSTTFAIGGYIGCKQSLVANVTWSVSDLVANSVVSSFA